MIEKITEVAVAIFQQADGSFLLSSRPEGKPYPNYWEFPGGKIETGESVRAALVRELVEELNVTITHATPWFAFIMRYTHATVRLQCWRVHAWEGTMRGMEGQQFSWQTLAALRTNAMTVAPTLPGCVPIFAALKLPKTYLITNASEMGVKNYLEKLRVAFNIKRPNTAPLLGFQPVVRPQLIQVREKMMAPQALEKFAGEVISLAHEHGAQVLINGDMGLAQRLKADGVHLTSAQLLNIKSRPAVPLVGASTHSRAELLRAAELGCDFAVMGPVKATKSHVGATPIGWDGFQTRTEATPIPCFAIGGMTHADMPDAVLHGAHGMAMMRGF